MKLDEYIYCPYSGQRMLIDQTTKEHIIPLSLGGANGFVIQVSAKFNSELGSSIDGVLANDFLMKMKRNEQAALGHSNKPPVVKSKKAQIVKQNKSIQISFDKEKGFQIWDPREKRYLSVEEVGEQQISFEFSISRWIRLKFAAKVALGSGYFIYGNQFIDNINHEELRTIMNLDFNNTQEELEKIKTGVYDQFMVPSDDDLADFQLYEMLCKFVNCSCIIAIPGPRNIGFIVGLLGQFIAALNVPAYTNEFPIDGVHDLGHVIILQKGKVVRMSYRELANKAYSFIKDKK